MTKISNTLSPPLRSMARRCLAWRKSLIALSAVLFIWLFGGIVILPYALQHFLTVTWAGKINRPVTLSAIYFNPWHWALTIEQFAVADKEGAVLISFDRLLVDYDMMSLFRLEYGVDAVEWQKPYVKLDADGQGAFSINALVPAETNASPEPATPPTLIPPVWIKRIALQDLVVEYRDMHRAVPFSQHLDPISFTLADFHTHDVTHGNHIALELHDGGDGVVTWDGEIRLDPLRIDGKLGVQNVSLLPLLDFAQLDRSFSLQSARLDAEAAHHIEMNPELSVTVQKARVALRDVRVSAEPEAPPVITLPSLVVDGIEVDLLKRAVTVSRVQLVDGLVHAVMEANGTINLQELFKQKSVAAADPVPAAVQPPPAQPVAEQQAPTTETVASQSVVQPEKTVAPDSWQVLIEQFSLDNYTVTFTDQTMTPPVELALTPIMVHASGIKPLTADPMDIQLAIGLPLGGEIALQTKVTVAPLTVNGDLQLKQIPLTLAQPYVAKKAKVLISRGTLETALKIDAAQKETLQLSLSGTGAVRDLDVHEKDQQRQLLSWHSVELTGLSYMLTDNALTIADVKVSKPYGRFIINADGTSNVQQLMIPASTPTSKAKPTATVQKAPMNSESTSEHVAVPPLAFAIKRVTVDDGDMGFADLSLKPNFRVSIEKLKGNIDAISTDPVVMAKVDLKGKVDRYAPVTIQGGFNVLGKTPAMDMAMAFKNIELTTFTPYSGTYAGFVIDKGQLSLDLSYKLANNKIEGKNHIVMNQLQLGQHVENKKAIDLPLRLAIALLRDENGVIDLGFEVNGNVDEPSFSVGGLLLKVLGNIVMKAVTAPFSLLSGLVGSSPEAPDIVAFQSGSAALDEAGETKVAAVAGMLQKRAMLSVNIRGNIQPDEDKLALQQQFLAEQWAKETGVPATTFLTPAAAVEAGAPRRLVGRLYKKLRNESLGDLEDRIKEDRLAQKASEDPATVKMTAYQQALTRLAEEVPIGEVELKQLAMARASQVKTVLLEKHGLPVSRVFVLDAANDDTQPASVAVLTLDAR